MRLPGIQKDIVPGGWPFPSSPCSGALCLAGVAGTGIPVRMQQLGMRRWRLLPGSPAAHQPSHYWVRSGKSKPKSIGSQNRHVHKPGPLRLCFDKTLKVIRTQLHTVSQLSPTLGPHLVTPGSTRLSSSRWQGGSSSSSLYAQVQSRREGPCIFSGNSC